jgi:hypothetical protein
MKIKVQVDECEYCGAVIYKFIGILLSEQICPKCGRSATKFIYGLYKKKKVRPPEPPYKSWHERLNS